MNNRIVYLGDIHGEWNIVECLAKDLKNQESEATIIQVGDFGVGFPDQMQGRKEGKRLDYLCSVLAQNNCKLLVLRGNHDDPAKFPGLWQDRIEFLPSNTRRLIYGKDHLFVGGAISVDRVGRKEGVSWWHDESIDVNGMMELLASDPTRPQVIVTHTAPNEANLPTPKWVNSLFSKDKTLKQELQRERDALSIVFKKFADRGRPIDWIYGHFHCHRILDVGGIIFRQLDINETYFPYQ